ncbi:hypothetical protein HK107_13745 [Parvularcula sp. ZS-1/3]|uniref:Flagellar hook-length control protein-like C-terminal domain-containing protein n=1 Tax=Parvularcula mediterranea TaxID=2732508 RepID=A0A7Y3W625_9PROT|nr:flagellar hook-length control protein FliK [Parvularcula mediterranea]NNU17390.1 hypothetical protein [Parvularcula mediterranea]
MASAAIIVPNNNAVTPMKGLGQGQRQPGQGGEEAAAGFTALLVQVEEIAALAGQAITGEVLPQQPVLQNAPQGNALGFETRGLGRDLTLPQGQAQPVQASQVPGQQLRPGELRPIGQLPDGAVRREAVLQQPLAQNGPVTPLDPAMIAVEEAKLADQRLAPPPKLETQIAAAPRVDAVIQQQATPETSNPVVRQVAANLQYMARGDMERVRFDLFPEELGRVQIQLQKSGAVTRVTIVTETAQAFEALARGSTALQQNLAQSGFDPDELNFMSRDGREEQREAFADERRERREDARREGDGEEAPRREIHVRAASTPQDRLLFL